MYKDGSFNGDVVRVSKFVLQLRIRGRCFNHISERLGNGKAVCCVRASFCACTYTRDYSYEKQDREHELHQTKLLSTARSSDVMA